MQRSQLSKRLDDVRKSLSLAESSVVVGLDPSLCEVEVNRIASDETARYILIKNQPSGGLCNDEIVIDGSVVEGRVLDTDGDGVSGNNDAVDTNYSDTVHTSSDRVGISSDKAATSNDILYNRIDSKVDTIRHMVDTESDTVGTSGDRVVNIGNDNMSTSNRRVHDNITDVITDDTVDTLVYNADDNASEPSLKRDCVNNISTSIVKDTTSYEADINDDKVSDTTELTSNKVDITGDITENRLIVTDDKMDVQCDKVDTQYDEVDTLCDNKVGTIDNAPCNKVTIPDNKFNTDVDKVDTKEIKASHMTTEQIISEMRDTTKVDGSTTEYSVPHTLELERTHKQPSQEVHDDIVTVQPDPVSNEVEIITSDSDSGMSLSLSQFPHYLHTPLSPL